MRKIYDHYLIDYKDGTRESINDLKTFYNKYMEFKRDKKMNIVDRWCGVSSQCHISHLSQYGLNQLFLWATEPETGGYVVCQCRKNIEYYKTDGGITRHLTDALILPKEAAEREMLTNRLYVKIIPCSVRERDAGQFDSDS